MGDRLLGWNGGVDFLHQLLIGLISANNSARINIYLIFRNKKKIIFFSKIILLFKLKKICSKEHQKELQNLKENKEIIGLFSYLKNKVNIIFFNSRKQTPAIFKKLKIDFSLFNNTNFKETPNVSFYPDLQHKCLTDFFTNKEIDTRNEEIANLLKNSKILILHSLNVKKDIIKFFPKESKNCHLFNLPFSPLLYNKNWLHKLKINIFNKYKLPKKYFLISNQFWIHKSHITAFKALAEISKTDQFKDIHIVCTGTTNDYRFPNYFEELVEKTKKLKIDKKIIYLGLIPKREQIEVMKNSLAIIQPTLFEGSTGGGVLGDAISIGVPAIISDIKVNLEAKKEVNIYYFKTKNHKDLANKMMKIIDNPPKRVTQKELEKKSKIRAVNLGNKLIEIGLKTIDLSK